jgi:hypothetical protein
MNKKVYIKIYLNFSGDEVNLVTLIIDTVEYMDLIDFINNGKKNTKSVWLKNIKKSINVLVSGYHSSSYRVVASLKNKR